MGPKALVTILILIFSGVLLFLLAVPQLKAVQDLRGGNIRLKDEVRLLSGKIVSTKNEVAKFQALGREDIERVESALPTGLDLPDLFVLIEDLIFSSGLVAQDIDIRETVGSKAAQGLEMATVTFSMIGTYESFKSFLEAAERSLRIFDVESIVFSSPVSGEKLGGFRFSVKMDTYFSK